MLSFEVAYQQTISLGSTPTSGGPVVRCALYDWTGGIEFWEIPVAPVERAAPYVIHCWFPTGEPRDTWSNPVPGFPTAYICCGGVDDVSITNDWEVAEFARNSIDFGVVLPELSPATDQVVGVPTWLAVTNNLDFPTVGANAGPVWARVTPVLRNVRWTFSNGESVTCTTDVATTWDPELTDAEQSSDCVHTFLSNGDGEPIRATAVITWDVWMESNVTVARGTGPEFWGPVEIQTDVALNVRELQAVID